jgi:hypothetical protein
MKTTGPVARKGVRGNKQIRGGTLTKADSAHAGGAPDLFLCRRAAKLSQLDVARMILKVGGISVMGE